MESVNKTAYIPLYGKALVSKKGIILQDKKAEEIWEKEQFSFKKKSKSKWLAYYMAMRAVVFDEWLKEKTDGLDDCVILQIGCGMDSRAERVGVKKGIFYDIDFPAVIAERKRYFHQTPRYQMIEGDIKNGEFLSLLPHAENAVVVMEGVSMYITNEELQGFFAKLSKQFSHISLLVDCYTPFAVKMSKIKNPVKEVGVSQVFGVENPAVLEKNTGLVFVKEWEITPMHLVRQLKGFEKFIFRSLYGGGLSKKIYKLYEYKT